MTKEKNFANWRAEQIAIVALLNSGFSQVFEDPKQLADFVAVSGKEDQSQYLVEVKASKTPTRTMKAFFKGFKGRAPSQQPFMLVVVDAEGGKGYFKVVRSGKESATLPLMRSELEKVLEAA